MSRPLGPYLREHVAGAWRLLMFRCPGCGITHDAYVSRGDAGPVNEWNGDMEAPTFRDLVVTDMPYSLEEFLTEAPIRRCAVKVRDGELHYTADSAHDMAGKRVPMEKFRHPEDLPPLPKQEPPRLSSKGWNRSPWRAV